MVERLWHVSDLRRNTVFLGDKGVEQRLGVLMVDLRPPKHRRGGRNTDRQCTSKPSLRPSATHDDSISEARKRECMDHIVSSTLSKGVGGYVLGCVENAFAECCAISCVDNGGG